MILYTNECVYFKPYVQPAMPASPIPSNYPFNEQWAPLAVYGYREHPFEGNYGASTNTQSERYENEQSEMPRGARPAFA